MEGEKDVVEVTDLTCDVCGERQFMEREGYYYCIECGTKKEQLRAVEISADDTYNDIAKFNTQRTLKKKAKAVEDNEITSWEFFNYVLRGFVQELLNLGAKPELKLMALQVWAAYLSGMEVAFCQKNPSSLPKLNVRALPRDARIIYNHKVVAKRKTKRLNQSMPHAEEDERATRRGWRKAKRKLDESGYTSKGSVSASSTAQSLKLQWSTKARKSLKKLMPMKHLDKHSDDSMGLLQCHKLRPKAFTLNKFDRTIYSLNIMKLYVVLGISLNLVGDDIQLTDLLRFIDEEHLTSRYVLNYLPENVAAKGTALLNELDWNHQVDKCRYKFLRDNIAHMSRFIDLSRFEKPDLAALTERYVQELNLPPVLVNYVCCLMDALPPTFDCMQSTFTYPKFEARVMAYIVYVMKLLFGLDDVKEREISDSAIAINEQLSQDSEQPLLFVYSEWMEYVELRKVLLAYYSESFARRFGIATKIGRKVDDYLNKEQKQKEQEYNHKEMLRTPAMQRKRENICLIFETLLKQQFGESSGSCATKDHIEFQPSLTPAHTYFQRLLLHASRMDHGELGVSIPPYMQVKHSERNLSPFKNQTAELEQYFAKHKLKLRVEELACQDAHYKVGIFHTLNKLQPRKREYRANCDIKMEDWLEELHSREKRPDFKFRQPVATYGGQYQGKILERAQRRKKLEAANPFFEIRETPTFMLKMEGEKRSLNDMHSIQVFDEDNMEPLRVPLQAPRRYLDSFMIKQEPLDAEPTEATEATEAMEPEQELILKISNFDCWLLHGSMGRIRDCSKRELRTLFPRSFRWLLETCAATLGLSWDILYEQLLVVEVMFHHGIEDWHNHKDHLCLNYINMNKDINGLTKSYRDMW